MARRKTHEQFLTDVENKFGNTYTIIGTYVKADVKIEIKHNICGFEWKSLPQNFMQGKSKCPKCSSKIPYTTETYSLFVDELTNGEYKVIGEYKNVNKKVKMRHIVCGYEWDIAPKDFKYFRCKCPRCQKRERYTTEDFGNIIKEITSGEYILKSEYVNNRIAIKIEHLACNTTFEISPSAFLNSNQRCPYCHDNSSKGEKRIAEILSANGIKFEQQYTFKDCKYTYLLRFDFSINHNDTFTLIEFDGGQHFFPVDFAGKGKEWAEEQLNVTTKRDQIKNKYCKENNIPLYRIPYWKFDEIESIVHKIIHNQEIEVDEASFLVQ